MCKYGHIKAGNPCLLLHWQFHFQVCACEPSGDSRRCPTVGSQHAHSLPVLHGVHTPFPYFLGAPSFIHSERDSRDFQGHCCIRMLSELVPPDTLHSQTPSKCSGLPVSPPRVRRLLFTPILCHVSSPGHQGCPLCTSVPHKTFE